MTIFTCALSALSISLLLFPASTLHAKTIRTNSLSVTNAPNWLTERKVEKLVDEVERLLEWQIRRIQVRWYNDENSFAAANTLKSNAVVALTAKADQSIHLGPNVTRENFDGVFTHELSHAIIYQKYKDAIPTWLQEGLANFISQSVAKRMGGAFKGRGQVDYTWLAKQTVEPVNALGHPFGDAATRTADRVRYRYQASTALMDMLARRCDVFDLLQLSVGKRIEPYIRNTCGIENLDQFLEKWIKSKVGR